MRLSVIIPTYNSQEHIVAQLEALARQQCDDEWEIIISDNGSTDHTVQVVEKYKSRFQELRIIDSGDKRGAAHARNVGVKAATGDTILFCDSDDVVGTGWLSAMASALCRYKFVAGAFEGKKLNSGGPLKCGRGVPQTHGLQNYDYPEFLPHAGGGNLGVRRYIHEMVGGFDETMPRLMDTDYCWKIQLAGFKLHFVPDALLHMRLRNTMAGSLNQARLWGRYNVFIYKKYLPFGMPALNWKRGVDTWIQLARQLPRIRTKIQFEKWLRQAAWQTGRVEGCIKYRILAL